MPVRDDALGVVRSEKNLVEVEDGYKDVDVRILGNVGDDYVVKVRAGTGDSDLGK